MNHQKCEMTIVVPVYNERSCLIPLCRQLNAFIRQSPIPCKVLFIDDGSTDGSQMLIKEISIGSSFYSYIFLETNKGLSTALKAGIDTIDTSLMGYIDADLQTSPSDFLKLLPYIQDHQMVNGIREKRNDGFIKRISSKIANACRRLVLQDGIEDSCCPLKIIWTSYAKNIPAYKGFHRFLPFLVQLGNGQVKQVPVSHFERFAGVSKYHLANRLTGPLTDMLGACWLRRRKIEYRIGTEHHE